MFFQYFAFLVPLQNRPLLPTGNILCPADGCRGFNPTDLGAGLEGISGTVVTIATLATYLIATLAVLWIIYAAFLFLVGGEDGAKKGRKVILNAIIAVVISAMSFTAVQILINILDKISFS